MQKEHARNDFIDSIKGIAIILVVLGHCIQYGLGDTWFASQLYYNNILFKIIYSFHMPLFMLVSGYLFYYSLSRKTEKEVIKSRFKNYLIPIASWSIIKTAIMYIQGTAYNYFVLTYVGVFLSSFWFLWAILICSIFTLGIKKFFNDNKVAHVIIILLFFVTPDGFNMGLYKYMYPYFVIGYYLNKKDIPQIFMRKVKVKKIIVAVIIVLYVLGICFWNSNSYIYISGVQIISANNVFDQLLKDMYRWIMGLFGSFILVFLWYYLVSVFKLLKICMWEFGQCSLGIYLISGLICSQLLKISSFIPPPECVANTMLFVLISFIFILIMSVLITKIIQKISIFRYVLFGNR